MEASNVARGVLARLGKVTFELRLKLDFMKQDFTEAGERCSGKGHFTCKEKSCGK